MLDFTKDTHWYVSSNFFARKFTKTDNEQIDLLVSTENTNDFEREMIWKSDNFISAALDGYISGKMFAVALVDKRNNHIVGIVTIKSAENKAVAETKIVLFSNQMSALLISDFVIWVIDYVFYCLHYREIDVYVDEKSAGVIEVLTGLKLNSSQSSSALKFEFNAREIRCLVYHLDECQWLSENIQYRLPIDNQQADQYILDVVNPFFKTCTTAPMYSTIIDFRYDAIMGTDQSSRSIGLNSWDEAIGTSYKYYSRIDTATWYFGKWYNDKTARVIHHYARKIFRIQQYVFKTGCPASYIDSLPYDRGIQSYLITFIPIFNPVRDVVAIQSIAVNYRLAGYHEYIQSLLEHKKPVDSIPSIKLSTREEEVLFLLICGLTQEQIAEILEIKRETVAAIIRNQLRVKFSLPIVNTKLLIETALAYGFPFSVPESLWRPSVIILEEKLAKWLRQYT